LILSADRARIFDEEIGNQAAVREKALLRVELNIRDVVEEIVEELQGGAIAD
jgi:hypothetical protein